MTVNSLSPAYVVVDYHTAFAPHRMTLPTLAWHIDLVNPDGFFDTWDSTGRDGAVMVDAFTDLLLPLYDNTFVVDGYTIYNKPLPTDVPQPVYEHRYTAKVGTGTPTGWSEAVQKTYFMRTTAFGASKLVLLDAWTNNNFGKYYTVTSDEQDLLDEFMQPFNGWSGRDNAKPNALRALTITLNERLRREYHLI